VYIIADILLCENLHLTVYSRLLVATYIKS